MLDDLDRRILSVLVNDGRATYQEIARAVRLSANATAERVRRLRESGVLRGYRAELDLAALGRGLVSLSDVRLREDTLNSDFQRELHVVPQIVTAVRTTGEYDYQLRVVCTGTEELEEVVERLKREHGVRDVRSRIVLREIELDPTRSLR
jgi:Lrp/AsnC family leucine-responsive transcriptional regulator